VSCNNDLQVTAISLAYCGLTGTLPDEISLLTNMEELVISGNRLEGSLPWLIFQKLDKLSSLDLLDNHFHFSIPTEIGLLAASLEKLTLAKNAITGSLPQEMKLLTKVNFVYFSDSGLEGDLFEFTPFWPNLIELYVSRTKLVARLTDDSLQLPMIEHLVLDATGTIPTTIGLMTGLQELLLSESLYSDEVLGGTLPSEIFKLVEMRLLAIQATSITGSLHSAIGNLSELRFLSLRSNLLSGALPSELGQLTKLGYFFVSFNHFVGNLPSELGSITSLKEIELLGNKLIIPEEVCNLPNKKVFRVDCSQQCVCCVKEGINCINL